MAKKKDLFPKEQFAVHVVGEFNALTQRKQPDHLVFRDDPKQHAELGVTKLVARYQLVDFLNVSGVTEVVDQDGRKSVERD